MPFQKGSSGNPAGRPRRTNEDKRQSVLAEHFDADAEARVVKAVIRAAQGGNVRAANWLWERKYGKQTDMPVAPSTIRVVYEDHPAPWDASPHDEDPRSYDRVAPFQPAKPNVIVEHKHYGALAEEYES